VAVAALPVERRDPVDEPPPEVWERIERGIADRRLRRRRAGAGLAVAAAAAGLALVAGVMGLVSGPADRGAAGGVAPAAPDRSGPWAGVEPTDPVEFSLGVDDAVGDEAWPSGDWAPFPEVDGLDARGRADLLRWLRTEEERLRGEDSA
jgi:hypothetical protein